MSTPLFAPAVPVEIAAAGYEAFAAGREHMKLHAAHGRRAEPTALAEAYRDAAESAFEQIIARIAPRPVD
ncbi:hypothetical protein [Kitasatospora sp. NPDC059160]|uniref:hypothetical protein n=1 Tax=Kitasatospora sp. NPDC059160 TaxID=3346748 RepID=UPI00367F27B1